MTNWRLLQHENEDNSYQKMALDEAILNSVSKNESPATLRFYSWKKPAVALGYFQAVDEEVNIQTCQKDKVEIFRRMTGGGAVYKDPKGELNYSLIIPESHPGIPRDILASYGAIEKGIIEGLRLLGLKAELNGVNDIVLNGKKISGNAQTRKNGVIFQHGTVLIDFDIKKMASYLKISREKISDKALKNIEDRVGTLRSHLSEASLFDIEKAIIKGFQTTFNVNIIPDKLSNEEKKDKKSLYEQKYSTREWNFWR
jgi:lipoate-protein ligase A